ncbi:MAG: 3'(2'),5'-bisphosphate nucleotidase [Nannocystaceae bacterium]|nr:3'(2'),5'-bisphosphate nucleotidase [Nannocystaceae bacterium]
MQRERAAAILAVRSAVGLTRGVQAGLSLRSMDKQDNSPVTVADFGSQALVCRALGTLLPNDTVVGEEDAADLSGASNAAFRVEVVRRVAEALGQDVPESDVLHWIDRGRGEADGRFWTIDPVDGTKGFLRGEHYAIALALIEDGRPVVAALGCPHLSVSPGAPPGLLLVACAGQGTFALPLLDGSDDVGTAVHTSAIETSAELRLVESVESAHSDHTWSAQLSAALGLAAPPVRLDSQAKYAVVCTGGAELYLRRPTQRDYVEKIWDHAAGALVVEESGGRVTDLSGAPLDFSRGATLSHNRGIVASNGRIHDRVLNALAELDSAS